MIYNKIYTAKNTIKGSHYTEGENTDEKNCNNTADRSYHYL